MFRCELGEKTVDSNLRTSGPPHEKRNETEKRESEEGRGLVRLPRTFSVRQEIRHTVVLLVYGALEILCKF